MPRRMLTALGTLLYALGINLFTTCDQDATVPDDILVLAKQRWEAKQACDWDKADQLRGTVLAMGWNIEDSKEGFHLSRV